MKRSSTNCYVLHVSPLKAKSQNEHNSDTQTTVIKLDHKRVVVILATIPKNKPKTNVGRSAHPHLSGCRLLSDREETLQEELHPEVCHCRSEEHGTLFTDEDALHVQRLHEAGGARRDNKLKSPKGWDISGRFLLSK